ncbi:hypothetical protein [Caballeronia sp. ATUFL_M1_KS5A]|uniref:hypothetical protein n=1 Tax=Caballeronia sp. ATUFL_M1_KS5A TaxID=2921778 RepID=UPI002028045A|nr:hypothetical protein [Caballeronia sp. ATUFL_M1_KS5A]
MNWLHFVSWFFGGTLLSNALPHLTSGVKGEPFQTPFANPPGEGLSSSTVNVLWGFLNLVGSYALVCHVGDFDLRRMQDALALALGMLTMGPFAARHFGRFHDGRIIERS